MKKSKILWTSLMIALVIVLITSISYFAFYQNKTFKLFSTDSEVVKWWLFEWYWWAIIILMSIVTPLIFVLFYLIRKNKKLKKKVLAIKIEEKGVLVGSKNFIDN